MWSDTKCSTASQSAKPTGGKNEQNSTRSRSHMRFVAMPHDARERPWQGWHLRVSFPLLWPNIGTGARTLALRRDACTNLLKELAWFGLTVTAPDRRGYRCLFVGHPYWIRCSATPGHEQNDLRTQATGLSFLLVSRCFATLRPIQ